MNYNSITKYDVNNGPGFRITLWVQGCRLHCKGCHNRELWNFKGGRKFNNFTVKRIIALCKDPKITGLTILGGEPLNSCINVVRLLCVFKEFFGDTKDVWLFTGYTYENLTKHPHPLINQILKRIDVLVDGPYKQELRDTSLKFRGSSNQRLINVPESLKQKKVITLN